MTRNLIVRYVLYIYLACICAVISAKNFNPIFQSLTLEEGLATLEVTGSFQQSTGYIWFGTSRGVSRFDGNEFHHFFYNPGKPNHISNNFVTSIQEDSFGNMWVGTEDGLNRISESGEVQIFGVANGLQSGWIISMLIDSSDNLWISSGTGIIRYDIKQNIFTDVPITQWGTNNALIELSDGRIIAAVLDKLVWLNSSNSTHPTVFEEPLKKLILHEDTIFYLSKVGEHQLALATEKSGLIIINIRDNTAIQLKTENGLASDYATAILPINHQQLIVGHYEDGLSLVDLSSSSIQTVRKREFDSLSLISNTIRHLLKDANKNIWVTTDSGVSKFNMDLDFEHYVAHPDRKGLSGKNVISTQPLNDDELVVLTQKGIDRLNVETGMVKQNLLQRPIDKMYKDANLWSMALKNNDLWVTASDGLIKLDLKSDTLKYYSNTAGNEYKLPETEIYTVLPEPNGGLWLTGYYIVGLTLFDENQGVINQYMASNSDIYQNEGNYTQDKIIANDGYVWMATTDGLFRVDRTTGQNRHIRLGEGRNYIRASAIKDDGNGNLWVATEGAGLAKISYDYTADEYKTKFYTTNDGLSTNELFGLAIDDESIWVFSAQNLSKFDLKTEQAISFPGLFQIPNLNFNLASAYIWNDRLVSSSNSGLFLIDYKALKQSDYMAPVVISEVNTPGNRHVYLGKGGPKQQGKGHIEFKFAALDYTRLGKSEFIYRLVNFDNEWHSASGNTVSFGNLPPGDYIFEVMGTNADGVWGSSTATYSFTVERPLRDYIIGMLILLLTLLFALNIRQRSKKFSDLHSQVRIDSLTGLPNRIGFNEQLNNSLKIERSIFALAVIDFDGFKDINDIHGHTVGDLFLKKVGQRLKDSIKGRDYIARLSGDEFVLMFYHFNNEENLLTLIRRIQDELSFGYQLGNTHIKCTVSIGVAIFPKDGVNRKELFSHADTAMYHAKKEGKNQIYFFNEELRKQLHTRIAIKANLEKALENDEFELYYQPKIHPQNKVIVGCEALIRWNHPEQGLVPPDQFIEEAEKNGFILELGAWVLSKACNDFITIKEKIPSIESMSVNISPIQLVRSDFISILDQAVNNSGITPENLELEITEYSLMDESARTMELLAQVKSRGVRIALDDFGTGYSSLSYLTKYPIDSLKIDRSIIDSACLGSPSLKVLHNIFLLAHSLEMQVVTEGVETLEQLRLLEDYNEDLIQGYLFSRPLPLMDLLNFDHNNLKEKFNSKGKN